MPGQAGHDGTAILGIVGLNEVVEKGSALKVEERSVTASSTMPPT